MAFAGLADRLASVREEIERVQAAEGVRREITIVAVTKGHPAGAVLGALEAGITDIGENRVQEALEKQGKLSGLPVRWHLIGHLQTNKAKLVAGTFALIHSIDSWRVAEAVATATAKKGNEEGQPVLLQVNVAKESQKTGCTPAEAPDLAQKIAADARLRLEGLMTMAPFTDDQRLQRRVFGDLRRLGERIAHSGVPVRHLSMGMSGDYRAAVAEGATMLRLGTILFGERGEREAQP
jgi:pyridoxal phosphate enzyme (YggS family)